MDVLKDFYWQSYQIVQTLAPQWITLLHDSFRLSVGMCRESVCAMCCVVLCCVVLCCVVLCCVVLCCVMTSYSKLCCVVLWCATLCHTVAMLLLFYPMWHYVILHNVTLCYVTYSLITSHNITLHYTTLHFAGNFATFMVDCPNYAIDTHIYQAWSWEGKFITIFFLLTWFTFQFLSLFFLCFSLHTVVLCLFSLISKIYSAPHCFTLL